jgi:ATP-dependent DNA helicase RecG
VVTKNPTRLLPEIPEGELTIQQLSNYTKNPLLVRVFHELHWAEDLGSGTRNILRYAPLYYPGYKIEINSGQQFVFSITYQDENFTIDEKISLSLDENVPEKVKMSQTNVPDKMKLSPSTSENVTYIVKMSQTGQEKVPELTDEELALPLEPFERLSVKEKKNRRRQAIVGLMSRDSHVSLKVMSEKLMSTARPFGVI